MAERLDSGYGAFGVSVSNVPAVIRYIKNQELHHRRMSFKEEYLAFLKSMAWNSIHGMSLNRCAAPFRGSVCGFNAYPPLPRWANIVTPRSGALAASVCPVRCNHDKLSNMRTKISRKGKSPKSCGTFRNVAAYLSRSTNTLPF
jgi:hypothetical protein